MNSCRVTDLRRKEVISSTNGCRIGFVDDVEFNTETAKVTAVIIYGRQRFFGFLGRREDVVIQWENICLIGEDTILVTHCPFTYHQHKKMKLSFSPFHH